MLILTVVIGQTWDHDPSADPVLQGQRSRQGSRLQVLRVGLRQLREAAVGKRRVLPTQRGQWVHGCRVHAGNWRQSWMREVQNAGFRDYSCLNLRGPRGRGVRKAAGDRAARRTVPVSTTTVVLVCEQSINSEVSWLLHRGLTQKSFRKKQKQTKTNKKKPKTKPKLGELRARTCAVRQREVRFHKIIGFPYLLQRFRRDDSIYIPLSPFKMLQITHVAPACVLVLYRNRQNDKGVELFGATAARLHPHRLLWAAIGCCLSRTDGPLIS